MYVCMYIYIYIYIYTHTCWRRSPRGSAAPPSPRLAGAAPWLYNGTQQTEAHKFDGSTEKHLLSKSMRIAVTPSLFTLCIYNI